MRNISLMFVLVSIVAAAVSSLHRMTNGNLKCLTFGLVERKKKKKIQDANLKSDFLVGI